MKKILISILLLSIVSYGQIQAKQEFANSHLHTINNWRTLDQSSYSIQYPSNWELSQNGEMGTSFILISPLESDMDKFNENVNLLIQDLTGQNIDLDKYTEISEWQIKTMLTNFTLIESKRIKIDEEECQKLIYSVDQGIFNLKFEQYYWVINDKAFVLTFTSEKDKFADYKEIGEKILNSFILKK